MNRTAAVLTTLTAALVAIALLRLHATGVAAAPLGLSHDDTVMAIRATRLLSGLAVGGALGAAGVILQTLLRNPLASPDVVGVSAGAGLGVMLNYYLAGNHVIAASIATSALWQVVPAGIGAAAVLALLVASAGWTLFRQNPSPSNAPAEPTALLLTGVVISVLCSAGVTFLQYLMPDAGFSVIRLLSGTLVDDTTWALAATAAIAVAAVVTLIATGGGRALDALTLSHDEAVSVGVNVPRVRLIALAVTGLLCAGAVVIAGPIGFVGLIAPHAARAALGPARASHRVLIIAAALAGATVVVAADTLVRMINLSAGRMPLGILTALAGAPTLLYLLRKDARARS